MDIGSWWNVIVGMSGDIGKFLTTDSFGQSIFLAILAGVGIVFWYFIRKRMEAPKKTAAPPVKG